MSINDKNMRMFQKWPGASESNLDLADTKEVVYEKIVLKIDELVEKARRASEINNPNKLENKDGYNKLAQLLEAVKEAIEPSVHNRMTR